MSLATLTLPETLAGIRERGLRMEAGEYTLRCGPTAALTDPLREALPVPTSARCCPSCAPGDR